MLHIDAALVSHNRVRHGGARGAAQFYCARLKEQARRHSVVASLLRRAAADRRAERPA